MTRARNTADTQDNNGGAVSPFVAGKNKIINGDFAINQRGFTSATISGAYGFDRWQLINGGDGTCTMSAQVFALGTAPVVGYESANFLRLVTANQTSTGVFSFPAQKIESVRTFANQTITISFWAKAASGTPKVAVEIEQNFGTGGSPSATVTNYFGQATLSTSWARYSVTGILSSISGKTIGTNNNDNLQVNFWVSSGSNFNSRTGSLGIQTGTFDFWGVQVEAGSVATPFTTATGTIQGELAACQRYLPAIPLATGQSAYMGYAYATNGIVYSIPFPVQARVSPTGITIPALSNFAAVNSANAAIQPTALTFDNANLNSATVLATATATSGTPNRLTFYANAAYMLFTGCEL